MVYKVNNATDIVHVLYMRCGYSVILLHFTHDQSNWSSQTFSSTTFPGSSDLLSEVSKLQHNTKLAAHVLDSSLNLSPICRWILSNAASATATQFWIYFICRTTYCSTTYCSTTYCTTTTLPNRWYIPRYPVAFDPSKSGSVAFKFSFPLFFSHSFPFNSLFQFQ
jgi:hypothetical protein